jgi:hypothetical protein
MTPFTQDFHFHILSNGSVRPAGSFRHCKLRADLHPHLLCTPDARTPSGSIVCASGTVSTGVSLRPLGHVTIPLFASLSFRLPVADSTLRASGRRQPRCRRGNPAAQNYRGW